MLDRRTFVAAGLAAAASCASSSTTRPAAKKNLLILGGTGFLGPHQVRCALARGHRVTVFNRGRSGKGMFGPDVEELVGDRNGDLSALQGRSFDAVIDESASQSNAPEWVQRAAELLRDRTEQYLFVSTRAVYLDTAAVPMTTAAPVLTRENSPVPAGGIGNPSCGPGPAGPRMAMSASAPTRPSPANEPDITPPSTPPKAPPRPR